MKKLATIIFLTLCLVALASAQKRPEILLQKGHPGSSKILCIEALPESDHYVTVGSEGAVKLWDSESHLVLRTIYDTSVYSNPEELGMLLGGAVSPQGDWVVTLGQGGVFSRYSLPQGRLLNKFTDSEASSSSALRTDGASLFYFRSKKLVRTDLQGKVQAELALEKVPEGNNRFAISGDKLNLALETKAGLSILNAGDLSERAFRALNSVPRGFRFSPDSSQLALRTSSAFAILKTSGLEVVSLVERGEDSRQIPVWSSSEVYLYPYSGAADERLMVFDKGSSSLNDLGEVPVANSAVVSDSGSFVVGSFGGSSWVFEPGQKQKVELASDIGGYPALTFDPVTGDMLTGSRSGEIVRWSSSSGREIQRYKGLRAYVGSVSVSPDGAKVLAADVSYGEVVCWDAKSGKTLSKVTLGDGRFLTGVKFAEFVDNDRYLVGVLGRKSPRFSLRKAADGSIINAWPFSSVPTDVALNSSKTRMVVGFAGGLLETDLVNKRDSLRTSLPRRTQGKSVCYGPDGKTIFAGGSDGNIYSWDSSEPGNKAELIHRFGRTEVRDLSLTDGQLKAILQNGKVVNLSLAGKVVDSMQLAETWIWNVTPVNENILATGGTNDSILFFSLKTGERLGRLAGVRDNSGWVYMERGGGFDGNDVGFETVQFELDGKLYGLSQFLEEYLRPGILAKVLPKAKSNARTGPELTAGSMKQPPKVDILSPVSGTVIETDTVEVKVKAASQGGGVADMALFHNGHRLPERQKKMLDSSTAVFTLRPVKGKNEFRATAFDSTRSVEARQDRVRVVAPDVKARPPRLHLLSVGVDEYTSGLSLKFAENDAQSVSKLFSSGLYAAGERKLLSNEQATLTGIKTAIESIAAEAEPQDAFVFYLAGHGTVIGEDYYFLPHDVKIETDQSVAQTAFSSDDLGKALQSVPATKQLLVLDSCRSGAAAGVVGRYFASRAGLEEIRSQQLLARASGTFLIAATKGEDYAYEIPQLGHGVLTYALLDSLGLKESNAKQAVTANELLRAVSTKVPALSEQYQGVRQQVIQYSSGQDFPLVK